MTNEGRSIRTGEGEIERRMLEHRAIEAMIWGMPLVNFGLMRQAMIGGTRARDNQIVYWSRPIDWKCQLLTPNTDLIYLLPFFDTREVGPVVVEIPPADGGLINGSLMDAWQTPLEDVGPAGVDKGKGGKYLVLPPGHEGAVPEGYVVLRSATYRGYGLMRALPADGSDAAIAKAAEYARRIQVYPLSKAAAPPPTVFVDANGTLFDANIPYDSRFFESLDRMVQAEPWLERDRAMIDTLRSIGIEKGKPFAPDAEMRELLGAAATRTRELLDSRFEANPPWHPSSRWSFLTSQLFQKAVQSDYADPNVYPTDDRGLLYSFIFFAPKRLVEGQFYLMTHRDRTGKALAGGRSYRLVVPPKVPARQYWSATVYDRETHGLLRNMPHAARSSQTPGLHVNPDGSVDLFFGPVPPHGKAANWVPTDPARPFEIIFRFYGTEKALFEKTWLLPDVEELT